MYQIIKHLTLGFFILFIVQSCADNKNSTEQQSAKRKADSLDQKEKEIKKLELELKQREIDLLKEELALKEKRNQKNNIGSDIPNLYKVVKPAVYLIYTTNDTLVSQGTAFVINNKGLAISNYHVFENASTAIAINEEGKRFMISEIITKNPELDYIIFRLGPSTYNFPYLNSAERLPEIGEACFAIGNPRGFVQTLSIGNISGYRENNMYIQSTAETTHGSSGGPLFNSKGEVIGITTLGLQEANLNFALNINRLPIKNILFQEKDAHLVSDNHNTNFDQNNTIYINFIKSYYEVLENESYYTLYDYFDIVLKRYYDKFNVSQEQAIQNTIDYKRIFKIKTFDIKPDWNSLTVNTLYNKNVILNYKIDYRIIRLDKTKPTRFLINMYMELSPENKIISIYENILSKH
jgi:serine protease Do